MRKWITSTCAAFAAHAPKPVVAALGLHRRNVTRPRTGAAQAGAMPEARIVLADHERLIVTYSMHDDTVYVLTPPGQDPRTVLRAASLILPQATYEDLADRLGISSAWRELRAGVGARQQP